MAARTATKFKPVKMGIVGVGGAGQRTARDLAELPETEIVAVCDANTDLARQVGEQYGVPHYADFHDLVRKSGAEAIFIATTHFIHPVVGIYALKKGLHVLTEKPVAASIGPADRMIKTAKKAKRLVGVMFQKRTTPSMRAAIDIVRKGKLGEVYRTLLISAGYRTQAYYDSGGWRGTWAGEGGGVLVNQAPHPLDAFCALTGLPSKVLANCRVRIHDIEVEDEAEAILTYRNGARGYVYVSTTEIPPTDLVEVCGEKGKLTLQGNRVRFWKVKPGVTAFAKRSKAAWGRPDVEEQEVQLPDCATGHREITRNFACAVRGKEKLIVSGEEALPSLELANAITLSAETGREVRLPVSRGGYEKLLAALKAKSRRKK